MDEYCIIHSLFYRPGIPQRRARNPHDVPECGILHSDVQAGWLSQLGSQLPRDHTSEEAPLPCLFQQGRGASCTHKTGHSNTCLWWHFYALLTRRTESFHLEGNQVLSSYLNRHVRPLDPGMTFRADEAMHKLLPFSRINTCRTKPWSIYIHGGSWHIRWPAFPPGTRSVERLQLATC